MSINSREIIRRSNLQQDMPIAVSPDSPLANLSQNHPLYGKYIASNDPYFNSADDPIDLEDLIVSDTQSIDSSPSPSDESNNSVQPALLETPKNISVDLTNYISKVTNDGSIVDTVYVYYDDVNGASSYEVRISSL